MLLGRLALVLLPTRRRVAFRGGSREHVPTGGALSSQKTAAGRGAGGDGQARGLLQDLTRRTWTHESVRMGRIILRRYAATTRCRENGNGYPAGGLWAVVGQSPLSALGTGREMGQDLLDDLGLFNEGDDPHRAATLGT